MEKQIDLYGAIQHLKLEKVLFMAREVSSVTGGVANKATLTLSAVEQKDTINLTKQVEA